MWSPYEQHAQHRSPLPLSTLFGSSRDAVLSPGSLARLAHSHSRAGRSAAPRFGAWLVLCHPSSAQFESTAPSEWMLYLLHTSRFQHLCRATCNTKKRRAEYYSLIRRDSVELSVDSKRINTKHTTINRITTGQ